MIDPASQAQLKEAIADCIGNDQDVLDDLREEICPLRSATRRIQPCATTSIALAGTDGGNNHLQDDSRQVWRNAAAVCDERATMVVSFGGITDRRADPLDLAKKSLWESAWRVTTIRDAGSAKRGKRQADTFLRTRTKPMGEYDVWALRK